MGNVCNWLKGFPDWTRPASRLQKADPGFSLWVRKTDVLQAGAPLRLRAYARTILLTTLTTAPPALASLSDATYVPGDAGAIAAPSFARLSFFRLLG